MLGSDATLI